MCLHIIGCKMENQELSERLSPEALDELIKEIEMGTGVQLNKRETSVRISEDKMEAWLYLAMPENNYNFTKNDLIQILEEHGVHEGFLESNLAAIAKKKVYDREILVARGKTPKEGSNGHYEFFFDPPNYKAAPKIREDGSVDYHSMSELPNVHKDQMLAMYHPAIPGEDGYEVNGRGLRPQMVRDLPPLRGRGISNQDNKNIYLARIDGKVEMKDNSIDIQPIHEIRGDVDMIIGKVEFFGDIKISGNVEAGVIIRAGRNVVIDGFVEAVQIFAGGDVILKRGISGNKKAKIIAKGSVMADFIENAEIEATGSVHANIILNSRVYSKDSILVTGKKGTIIGGITHGLTGLMAMNLGNDVEVRTIVHVGFEPGSYERFVYLTRKETDLKRELAELVDEMANILRRKRTTGELAITEEDKLVRHNKKKDEIFIELDNIRMEREKLALEISRGRGAKVHVEGNINRGVIIGAENAQMLIDRSTVYMEYSCVSGQVQGNVIIYK